MYHFGIRTDDITAIFCYIIERSTLQYMQSIFAPYLFSIFISDFLVKSENFFCLK